MSFVPLYEGIMTLGAPAIELLLSSRLRHGKEDRQRLPERRGVAGMARPAGDLIWLHASSVGESVAALIFIKRLLSDSADRHVLLTTGTVSSADLMKDRLPDRAFHQFVPIDRPAWVRRFLDHWRPDVMLVMESEFWPAQLSAARKRGIPIVLVNGRMSERSFSRWNVAGALAKPLFRMFDLILATNPEQADRFRKLGAADVKIPGNLKRAAEPLPLRPDAVNELRQQIGTRPVWCAASTHAGEDEALFDVHNALLAKWPDLVLLLVPRHPHRCPDIVQHAHERNLTTATRSANETISNSTQVYVADTLGEMAVFFELAQTVFVAGSLVPVGGHNPVEPAHFECAVVFGPLMSKNTEIADDMLAAGAAVQIENAAELTETVSDLLENDARRTDLQNKALRFATDARNIVDSIVREITPLLSASTKSLTVR